MPRRSGARRRRCAGGLRRARSCVPRCAPSAAAKPRQRCSSAALPTSWMTHSADAHGRHVMRRPAAYPASYSSSPTCSRVPTRAKCVAAGVDRYDRNPGPLGGAERRRERARVRQRDDQAGRPRVAVAGLIRSRIRAMCTCRGPRSDGHPVGRPLPRHRSGRPPRRGPTPAPCVITKKRIRRRR